MKRIARLIGVLVFLASGAGIVLMTLRPDAGPIPPLDGMVWSPLARDVLHWAAWVVLAAAGLQTAFSLKRATGPLALALLLAGLSIGYDWAVGRAGGPRLQELLWGDATLAALATLAVFGCLVALDEEAARASLDERLPAAA